MVDYHLLGVGGIGMSALAEILLDQKGKVSGSDKKVTPLVKKLEEKGMALTDEWEGTLVTSTAIPKAHPALAKAKKKGYPILHRSDLLRELARPFKTLAVAGTHGKTTTTSLLSWVLLESGLDPGFAIGGILPKLNRNGRHGKGEYFVLEADESDGSFLNCDPYGAIVTGVEAEHLYYWKSCDPLYGAFEAFMDKTKLLFWCGDDPYLKSKKPSGISYGFGARCDLKASDLVQEGFSLTFNAHFEGEVTSLTLPLIGRHNALNALAVFGMCRKLGLSALQIQAAFATFPGLKRRCERIEGEKGLLLIDDYAHHPTEVKTTLEGVRRAVKERRLVAFFEPHRCSRLQECWEAFCTSFEAADEVWVTDVYPAGEAPIEGISGEAFARDLAKRIPKPVHFNPSIELGPTDVLVGLGAGGITDQIHALKSYDPKKRKIGVLSGGLSPEHTVSLVSGKAIADAIPRERYTVCEFPIGRDGDVRKYLSELLTCDLIIPAFHGPYGEDGQFAALCESLQIPYLGCDFLAAALCMDKPKIKRLVESVGIPVTPYVTLTRQEREGVASRVAHFGFPLFVKTANSGSSLGVYRVESEKELEEALSASFALDREVVVEKGVVGREIEFAVLGNEEVEVPPPGELLSYGRMYTYAAKYETPFDTDPAPNLPPKLLEEGRLYAKQVYQLIGCMGLTRVDFFLDQEEQWWFNEANPFPGFTPISLYPKVWAANGLPFEQLIERLINLGLARARKKRVYQKGMEWIAP